MATTGGQRFLAVVDEAIWGRIPAAIRKSKYDLHVNMSKGDVALVIITPKLQVPQVVVIPGKEDSLDYHPGNIIVTRRRISSADTILYQNQIFAVITNQALMQQNALGMIKRGADATNFLELLERIIIDRARKGQYTQQDELGWEKYLKLRARFTHPTTPKPEADACRKIAARVIRGICFPPNNGNGGQK